MDEEEKTFTLTYRLIIEAEYEMQWDCLGNLQQALDEIPDCDLFSSLDGPNGQIVKREIVRVEMDEDEDSE